MFTAGETVTVIRPGGQDRTGDGVTDARFDVEGCAIIQQSTADDRGSADRRAAVTTIELLCPAGADVRRGDKVKIGDVTYLVDGQPWTPHSPFTGWEPGLNVRLRGVV